MTLDVVATATSNLSTSKYRNTLFVQMLRHDPVTPSIASNRPTWPSPDSTFIFIFQDPLPDGDAEHLHQQAEQEREAGRPRWPGPSNGPEARRHGEQKQRREEQQVPEATAHREEGASPGMRRVDSHVAAEDVWTVCAPELEPDACKC